MKNKLSDLNDHLFAQLERLGAEDMTPEQIEAEVQRTEAIVAVSDQIAGLAGMQLQAAKLYAQHGPAVADYLPRIGRALPPKEGEG